MTYNKFKLLGDLALNIFRSLTPIDTGNLRYNAVKLKVENENTIVIYVDEVIAPYVKYTVGKWEHKYTQMGNFKRGEVVTRFRYWDNPNEGWFDKAVLTVAKEMTSALKGQLSIE